MGIRVERWTGQEASALQQVLRMADRDYAEHLDVSRTTVVTWRRKGELVVCNKLTAQLLDSAVALLSPTDRNTFEMLLQRVSEPPPESPATTRRAPGQQLSLVSHQFIPVPLGAAADGLFGTGHGCPVGPAAMEQRAHPLADPGDRRARLHVYRFGIGVLHIRQDLLPASVTELAIWRYRSYPENRNWAQKAVLDLATRLGLSIQAPEPEYVLSVYELRQHGWTEAELETGLHLLATPSILVDRSDETNPVALGVEEQRFSQGWRDPAAISFHGGASRGVAGWSGVAYFPQPDEKALPIDAVVSMELDVQALWALSLHLHRTVENGQDPHMPQEFGWRFLRAVHSRLTSARSTETAQHRAMRAAVVGTSDLPQRLKDVWAAMKEVEA
ncbi:XRE family transcriptional regulator [Kitasatospora sp. NPDC059088]|uniref:XRE family transcriptional regulator n=1 Tax=Kitasatospora sp. NPDC059088 TaxID=3346722 RepID=UPI0036C45E43